MMPHLLCWEAVKKLVSTSILIVVDLYLGFPRIMLPKLRLCILMSYI